MRTKEEIVEELNSIIQNKKQPITENSALLAAILEILLDVRDIALIGFGYGDVEEDDADATEETGSAKKA